MPPGIGRQFSARGFLFSYQAGSHIWDAIDRVKIKCVLFGIFDVPEDIIMLGWPAVACPAAVIVRPDDLVQE